VGSTRHIYKMESGTVLFTWDFPRETNRSFFVNCADLFLEELL
jgi:hypothetical protein